MKRSWIFGIITLMGLLVSACEEEYAPRIFPRVQTLPATNIHDDGATFTGEIVAQGGGPVIEHGFLWGLEPSLFVDSSEKMILDGPLTSEKFSAIVHSALRKDTTYYVRAFVSNGEYLVYGNSIPFFSKGGLPPELTDFQPRTGTAGDTVQLIGERFSALNRTNEVFFTSGDQRYPSLIVHSSDTLIYCLVPDDIAEEKVRIELDVAGNTVVSDDFFTLDIPQVTSFTPEQGTYGETVVIKGMHFHEIPEENQVFFGDIPAEVTDATGTGLQVTVPPGIRSKSSAIRVVVNMRSGVSEHEFSLLPPVISQVIPTRPYQTYTITIQGKNFCPQITGNLVMLGDTEGEITEAATDRLVVRVPQTHYSSRTFKVEVTTAEQKAVSDETIELQDPWIRKAQAPSRAYDDSAVGSANGNGYMLVRGSNEMWKYTPTADEWTQVATYPGASRYRAFMFTLDGDIYIGGGHNQNSDPIKQLWKYVPATNSWTRMNDLPVAVSYAVGLSAAGKGYICTISSLNNFWEYNPVTDGWKSITNLNVAGSPDTGFEINGKLYIYVSGNSTGLHQLYQFDPATSVWQQKKDMINYGIRTGLTGVSVGNQGYILGYYYIHQYDPASNTWLKIDDYFNHSQNTGQYGLSFEAGGKIYFKNGSRYQSDDQRFWEFDPEFR